MKTYVYKHPKEIEFTGDIKVFNGEHHVVASVKRIYDNFLKKTFDRYFDYRYFLKYEVEDHKGNKRFFIKKKIRRGQLWYEGFDFVTNNKYTISYENWRLGIPELYITDGSLKIIIHKELEGWSEFVYQDQVIAKWKAEFVNEEFKITLQIEENSPIDSVEFFIGICQATLFIGA